MFLRGSGERKCWKWALTVWKQTSKCLHFHLQLAVSLSRTNHIFRSRVHESFVVNLRRKNTFWLTFSDSLLYKRPTLPMPIYNKRKIILALCMQWGAIISGYRERDRVVPEQAEQSGKHELNRSRESHPYSTRHRIRDILFQRTELSVIWFSTAGWNSCQDPSLCKWKEGKCYFIFPFFPLHLNLPVHWNHNALYYYQTSPLLALKQKCPQQLLVSCSF